MPLRAADLTISLTSTSLRIARTGPVLQSLLGQRLRPARVVLWLSSEPHLIDAGVSPQDLPANVAALRERGLEIRWTPNRGPYRKLLPALEAFGGAVATADDDTLYPPDWLEGLLRMHAETPGAVCCYRARRILLDQECKPSGYWRWPRYGSAVARALCFPVGKDGVLYPADALHADVLDYAAAQTLAPSSDDIWFKAMALRRGTLARACPGHERFPIVALNAAAGLSARYNWLANDAALARVFGHYGLSERLRSPRHRRTPVPAEPQPRLEPPPPQP